MQNLFKQQKNFSQFSHTVAVVKAGSLTADETTNRRFLLHLRVFFAVTCRDIERFSFQRWARIYYAEFVIFQCETRFKCPFVDIDFAILVSMEHSATRGKQRLLIFSWSLSDWNTKLKLKLVNFCGEKGNRVLWHFSRIWNVAKLSPPTAHFSIFIGFIWTIGSIFCLFSVAKSAFLYRRCLSRIVQEIMFYSRTEFWIKIW